MMQPTKCEPLAALRSRFNDLHINPRKRPSSPAVVDLVSR